MDKSVTIDKVVSDPISAPSLDTNVLVEIETQINNETLLQQLISNKVYIFIIIIIIVLIFIIVVKKTIHFF